MYGSKISRRFNHFYCIDVYSDSIVDGQKKAWILGKTPVALTTDASARHLAGMLVNDCNSESVTHTLFVNEAPILCGSKKSLNHLASTWKKQSMFTTVKMEVREEIVPPNQDENKDITLYLVSHGSKPTVPKP